MGLVTPGRHQVSALPGFVQVLQQGRMHQRRPGLQIQHFLHLKWALWLQLLGMLGPPCWTTIEKDKKDKNSHFRKKKKTPKNKPRYSAAIWWLLKVHSSVVMWSCLFGSLWFLHTHFFQLQPTKKCDNTGGDTLIHTFEFALSLANINATPNPAGYFCQAASLCFCYFLPVECNEIWNRKQVTWETDCVLMFSIRYYINYKCICHQWVFWMSWTPFQNSLGAAGEVT